MSESSTVNHFIVVLSYDFNSFCEEKIQFIRLLLDNSTHNFFILFLDIYSKFIKHNRIESDLRAEIGQVVYDGEIKTMDKVNWQFLQRLFSLPEKYESSES